MVKLLGLEVLGYNVGLTIDSMMVLAAVVVPVMSHVGVVLRSNSSWIKVLISCVSLSHCSFFIVICVSPHGFHL